GLGQVLGDVVLVEENLTLQVAGLDEVAVDQAQVADARADERVGQHGPQRSAAAQGDVTVQQPPLPLLPDAVEAHLAAVAFQRQFHLIPLLVHPLLVRPLLVRPLLLSRRRGRPTWTSEPGSTPWATSPDGPETSRRSCPRGPCADRPLVSAAGSRRGDRAPRRPQRGGRPLRRSR